MVYRAFLDRIDHVFPCLLGSVFFRTALQFLVKSGNIYLDIIFYCLQQLVFCLFGGQTGNSFQYTGSLNVFNHRTNVDIDNRVVCYDIKELGKQLKQLGMLVVQDQVWNRVTRNREAGKTTRYYVDEFHLLLRGELSAWSVEIWKRFRKWGGVPTGVTQNVKDLLASPEAENILENSDYITLALIAATRGVVSKMPMEPATLCNISIHMKSVFISWRKGMS